MNSDMTPDREADGRLAERPDFRANVHYGVVRSRDEA